MPKVKSPSTGQTGSQPLRAKFFEGSVAPAIDEFHLQNEEAAERCIRKVEDLFAAYAEGTGPFVEHIMSFGSRWNALRNMGYDWWYQDDSNSRMVSALFQQYYFDSNDLNRQLTTILNDFRDEVLANQRTLLAEIRAKADLAEMPSLKIPSYEAFNKDVEHGLRHLSADAVNDSVSGAIVTLLVSEVGSVVASRLVVKIIARLGTTAVTTLAAGGGSAMVGGAAVGGGGGAIGGPPGAAVGAVVGIVVGVVIDYFMTKSSKAKLTCRMNEVLSSFEAAIVEGNSQSEGLRSALEKACNVYQANVRSSLFSAIVEKRGL